MVFCIFLNFFAIFFRIFYYGSGRHTLKRFFFLFSPFRGLSQLILSWKEAMMEFCNFLNFFAIFLEFSIRSRVGTHQNYFFFLTFSAFHKLFRLEKKLRWCFQIFWILLLFFWYFLLRVGKEHIGKIFFYYFLSFSAFPILFLLEKELWWFFINFWTFFIFFYNFLFPVG